MTADYPFVCVAAGLPRRRSGVKPLLHGGAA